MDISQQLEFTRIEELKIVHNVRIIYRHDLNPISSDDNIHLQFNITGEARGNITCYLCLDGHELSPTERNYLIPLFVESMNILIGRQISLDEEISTLRLHLAPPKLNLNSAPIRTQGKRLIQKYRIELETTSFDVLTDYHLEVLN
jgi:hypothetical protein